MIDITITKQARSNPQDGEYHFPLLELADLLFNRLEKSQLCCNLSTSCDHNGNIVAVCFYTHDAQLQGILQIIEDVYGSNHNLDIAGLREGEIQRHPIPTLRP